MRDEADRLSEIRRLYTAPVAGVSDAIAAAERMMVVENGGAGERAHYFSVSQSAAECVRRVLADAGRTDVTAVLDLPCGHGRVMRSIRAAWPAARITACDLLRDGVDHCVAAFGATGVYSTPTPPEAAAFPDRYDLIFCGSLLTHLPPARWREFIALFRSLLVPGGVMVVSLHGPYAAHRIASGEYLFGVEPPRARQLLEAYQSAGFGYVTAPGGEEYGTTLAAPWWSVRQFNAFSDLRVVHYRERAWDDHHDVIGVVRRDF